MCCLDWWLVTQEADLSTGPPVPCTASHTWRFAFTVVFFDSVTNVCVELGHIISLCATCVYYTECPKLSTNAQNHSTVITRYKSIVRICHCCQIPPSILTVQGSCYRFRLLFWICYHIGSCYFGFAIIVERQHILWVWDGCKKWCRLEFLRCLF